MRCGAAGSYGGFCGAEVVVQRGTVTVWVPEVRLFGCLLWACLGEGTGRYGGAAQPGFVGSMHKLHRPLQSFFDVSTVSCLFALPYRRQT